MKRWIFIFIALLPLADATAYAASGEVVGNPNNSSYPSSSQPNSPPNEPDSTFGNASSTHKLPAHILHKKKGATYDPAAPATIDDNRLTAPANTDVTGSPHSGNTGIVVPVPGSAAR